MQGGPVSSGRAFLRPGHSPQISPIPRMLVRPATRRQISEWYWVPLLAAAALLVLAQLLSLREQAA